MNLGVIITIIIVRGYSKIYINIKLNAVKRDKRCLSLFIEFSV